MPRQVPLAAAACGLAIAALALSLPASAASLAFTCEEKDAGKPATMTLTYEGEATGTLKVVASFGEMLLPATKEETEVEVDGQKVKQTGIRAFGEAKIMMPEKAAFEACIVKSRMPDMDDDILGVMGCRSQVAPAPTDATVNVEVVMGGAVGGPLVFLNRTYVEQSIDYLAGNGKKGGRIAIESVPPPACTTAKAP